jgi:hypothetical protein
MRSGSVRLLINVSPAEFVSELSASSKDTFNIVPDGMTIFAATGLAAGTGESAFAAGSEHPKAPANTLDTNAI